VTRHYRTLSEEFDVQLNLAVAGGVPAPSFLPCREYSAGAGTLLRGELASEGGSIDHDDVRARRFELIDEEGRPRAVLTSGEGTHLVVVG
jgi:hypothetical protein